MEIKIRNINEPTVNKIDQLAKELYGNKKGSRGKFLKTKLEEIAFKEERNQLELQYQSLLNHLIEVMQMHSNIMSEIIKEFDIDIDKFYSYENRCLPLDDSISIKDSSNDTQSTTKDILIRDMDRNLIDIIDKISSKKGLSRSEYINMYLNQIIYSDSLKIIDEKYDYLIEQTLGIIDFSNKIFEVVLDKSVIDISKFLKAEEYLYQKKNKKSFNLTDREGD